MPLEPAPSEGGKQTASSLLNRRVGHKLQETDGRIDPGRLAQGLSSITQTLYTIIDLKIAYRSRRGNNARIENDTFFPKALAPFFFT
jgi:hypothetical protein